MFAPLIVDSKDAKWTMLKEVLKTFDSRRARQELAKHGLPVQKGAVILKIVLTAMFFSVDVSYVVRELNHRRELRHFLNVGYVLDSRYIYRFLSQLTPELFVDLVLRLLNLQCGKRGKKRAWLIIDSTDLQLDINWFRRRIKKADLEDREFKWGYSPSKGYYIGYKLTMVVDKHKLKPLAFLIHEGSPNDAKLFKEVMEELKRRRVARAGDVVIADKGYYSYKNYVMAISRFKVVPLIFPRKNFSLTRLLGMFSYPLEIFYSKSSKKLLFLKLVREFAGLIDNWRRFKATRSVIDDLFKVTKNSFAMDNLHRYTKRSVKKFVALNVLLVGMVVSLGFREKEALQRLAEW